MNKIQAMILSALVMTGCASAPTPAVVRVEVPVLVTCKISTPDKPNYAVDALPIGADIWDKMSALRADRITRKAYEAELEAAINSCQ